MPKRKIKFILINTLLLHIPLLALTDGRRNKYTRCAWAGGPFFPVVLLCQFFVLAGIVFGPTYLHTLLNTLFYELIFF